MESDCQKIGRRSSDVWKNRKAMSWKVRKYVNVRYHNHLDASIMHSEWARDEELLMYKLHDNMGNKWAIISQKLPGRYFVVDSEPTTAWRTTFIPNCERPFESWTKSSTITSKRSSNKSKSPFCTKSSKLPMKNSRTVLPSTNRFLKPAAVPLSLT